TFFLFTASCKTKVALLEIFVLLFTAETEADAAASESKAQKETIDLKELKRVDHILMSLQRKLPPAPPPPPFPDGYVPSEQEKGPDDLLASEALPPAIDPIIDQGPAKRPRFQ
uniref:Mediator complex subunit 6 n=1 Tax=Aegilops tauschii subsp. strangulata TaxID=200361 RepID=A0A453R469_AEGTS